MLGKLIKYDLKALAKILAPLWGVLLVMGLIFGISIRSNLDGIGNTMIVFSLVVIVAVIVAIFVMNVIIVIQRFWNGLLQEEGYLMFTLPVTTRSLILSKVISALIISCGTALVISLLGVEIIAISPVKLMDTVTYFGNWVIKVHAGPWIGYGAVIAVVGLLSGIYHIYVAMVIGQLSNGNRFLFAFVAYAGLSIIVSLIGIPSMTNLDNMGSSLQNTFGFDSDLWIYLVENIVIIIIYHIVTIWSRKNRRDKERSKNRFATTIIVGAFLFLAGYEMQEILLRHNRYYSWFYLPCLIAFLVEIVLCHLVIEFILTRKLNIN